MRGVWIVVLWIQCKLPKRKTALVKANAVYGKFIYISSTGYVLYTVMDFHPPRQNLIAITSDNNPRYTVAESQTPMNPSSM